jgi:hypothetical protein
MSSANQPRSWTIQCRSQFQLEPAQNTPPAYQCSIFESNQEHASWIFFTPKDFFLDFYKENEVYAYKNIVLTQVPNSKEPHTATAVARKTIHSDPCPLLPLYGAFPAAAPAPDAAMAPHAPLAPGGTAAGRHRATSSCSCCAPRPSCRVAVGRCQRLRWRKETEGAALQWSSSGDAAPDEESVAAIPGGTERVRGVAPPRCQVSSLTPCLDTEFLPKFHYAKRRFPIISKCRHMHGVLNVDEIKN